MEHEHEYEESTENDQPLPLKLCFGVAVGFCLFLCPFFDGGSWGFVDTSGKINIKSITEQEN
jgi:hypothetical protein